MTVYGSGHKGKCLPHALSLVPPRSGASRAEPSDLCNQSLPEKYPLTGGSVFCHSSQPARQWDSEPGDLRTEMWVRKLSVREAEVGGTFPIGA